MKRMGSLVLVLCLGAAASLNAAVAKPKKLKSKMLFYNSTKEPITVGLTEDPRQVATGPANNKLHANLNWKAAPKEIAPGEHHAFYIHAPGGLKGVIQFPGSKKHFTIGMGLPKAKYFITGSDYRNVTKSDANAPVVLHK